MLKGVRKIFITFLLSLIVFSSAVPYLLFPQKTEASVPVVDAGQIANSALQIKQFMEYLQKFQDLTGINAKDLYANIKGIMGQYGLGDLTDSMSGLLSDLGVNDLLKGIKEWGGGIGAGGLLQGALGGVLTPEQTINMVMNQFGLRIPEGISKVLQTAGIFNTSDIVRIMAGKDANKSCKVANEEEVNKVRYVIWKYGQDIPSDMVKALIGKCAIDKDKALAQLDPPTATPTEAGKLAAAPCNRRANDGTCLRTASSFNEGKNGSFDLPTDPSSFIEKFFTIFLGIAGGIALLSILLSGYKLLTSQGKPESIQQGREQLIAAIVGLIFIIFSFVIFQLVVVDILRIPGICKNANDPKCAAPKYRTPYDPNASPNSEVNTAPTSKAICLKTCSDSNATIDSCMKSIWGNVTTGGCLLDPNSKSCQDAKQAKCGKPEDCSAKCANQ